MEVTSQLRVLPPKCLVFCQLDTLSILTQFFYKTHAQTHDFNSSMGKYQWIILVLKFCEPFGLKKNKTKAFLFCLMLLL